MKNVFKIFLSLLITLTLVSGCNTPALEQPDYVVDIFIPCYEDGKWSNDALEIQRILENENYQINIYYANKDTSIQRQQIENSIENDNADVFVICPVEQNKLSDILISAKEKNILIISYEKLIENSDSVDYYVSFDNALIGIQQASSLIEGMLKQGKGPYNVEIFISSHFDDINNSYYRGAMSVLMPLIESGDIIVPSGQILSSDISIENWSIEADINRFKNILSEYYNNGQPLNGILSPSDNLSEEFINIINQKRYYSSNIYPVITGQNPDTQTIVSIISTKQYSTIFLNYKALARVTSNMIIAIMNGQTPEINDNSTFYNGEKIVPSYLCEPILVTKENYEETLIATGHIYYDDIFQTDH